MELIIILIVLAAIVLGVLAYASHDQVATAAMRADIDMIAPGGADFFSGWSGMLFQVAVGLLVLTAFVLLVVKVVVPWVRRQLKGPGKGWKSGPNARWGRVEEPKMDMEKVMTLAILSRLAGGDGGVPLMLQQPPEMPQEAQSQFPEGWGS